MPKSLQVGCEQAGRIQKSSSLRNGWKSQGCFSWRKTEMNINTVAKCVKGYQRGVLLSTKPTWWLHQKQSADCKEGDNGPTREETNHIQSNRCSCPPRTALPEDMQAVLSAGGKAISFSSHVPHFRSKRHAWSNYILTWCFDSVPDCFPSVFTSQVSSIHVRTGPFSNVNKAWLQPSSSSRSSGGGRSVNKLLPHMWWIQPGGGPAAGRPGWGDTGTASLSPESLTDMPSSLGPTPYFQLEVDLLGLRLTSSSSVILVCPDCCRHQLGSLPGSQGQPVCRCWRGRKQAAKQHIQTHTCECTEIQGQMWRS